MFYEKSIKNKFQKFRRIVLEIEFRTEKTA